MELAQVLVESVTGSILHVQVRSRWWKGWLSISFLHAALAQVQVEDVTDAILPSVHVQIKDAEWHRWRPPAALFKSDVLSGAQQMGRRGGWGGVGGGTGRSMLQAA